MSARKTLPIGIIVMTLIMALAALGVGYAWWTEQLTAAGSIQTGSIDVKIENITINEEDPLGVGGCAAEKTSDGKGLSIFVSNAYPGYTCQPVFQLYNYGTVPAKVTGVNTCNCGPELAFVPGGAIADHTLLPPENPILADLKLSITENALPKNDQYEFSLSIDVAQGNAP